MEQLRKEQIEACKTLVAMYQELMIETQSEIRKGHNKIEVNQNLYKTYKAHYEEYKNHLNQLEGENNNDKK